MEDPTTQDLLKEIEGDATTAIIEAVRELEQEVDLQEAEEKYGNTP